MLLKDKFFTIVKEDKSSDNACTFHVKLLDDCECYKGHFPGNPVSPGVCNVEMIRECAELLTGKDLKIKGIKVCRLTAIASPVVSPELAVSVNLTPGTDENYTVTADISDAEKSYMSAKMELTIAK